MLKAIELFAGAGGLGMGVSLAGFKTMAALEYDKWACDTLRENQNRSHPLVNGWDVMEMDVRDCDFTPWRNEVDLVAGGPPCQPFSLGGKHKAQLDKRDMFPSMIRAIRETRPKAFIVENVKGLTRKTFTNYLEYIRFQLEFPHIEIGQGETWSEHFTRLQRHRTQGYRGDDSYEVVPNILNAADFGVPQRRERYFLVGFRHDLHVQWSFPEQGTHSSDALAHAQHITGEYWDRHRVQKKHRPRVPQRSKRLMERLKSEPPIGRPWRTVRDALEGIPDPEKGPTDGFFNHTFQPGARSYPGHTGSPIDLPAKTLKAGVHGVPGGENMMVKPDGSIRYFTVRESARLQTFPDTYVFHGSWTETMRQLGNAVPVTLGRMLAASIAQTLLESEEKRLRESLTSEGMMVAQ